jgi:3-oxoisoapionate-4-phosphate transcarboxylase/hydrolase
MDIIKAVFSIKRDDADKHIIENYIADLEGGIVQTLNLDSSEHFALERAHDIEWVWTDQNSSDRRFFQTEIPASWVEGGGIPGLITVLLANALEFGHFRLESLELPDSIIRKAPGPQFGVSGIRALLGKPDGPIFGVALKPNIPRSLKEKKEVAVALARAGVDIVKDDEMCFTKPSVIVEQAAQIQEAMDRSSKIGSRPCYVPNFSSTFLNIEHFHALSSAGVRGAMINFLVTGWDKPWLLATESRTSIFLYGHRALQEIFIPHLAMPVIALLARMAGFDFVHVGTPQPNHIDKIKEVSASLEVLKVDCGSMKDTLPVFSKTSSQLAKWLIKEYSNDIVIMACGTIYKNNDPQKYGELWIEEILNN